MSYQLDNNNDEIDLEFDEILDALDHNVSPESPSSIPISSIWTKKEKILVGFFMFIGISTLLLGFAQFYSRKTLTLEEIFGSNQAGREPVNIFGNGTAQENKDLRFIDTDKDGLSDADELNKYKTSPYLEDTDSDGINDGQELENGKDPNCPEGETCSYNATANEGGIVTGFGNGTDIDLNSDAVSGINQDDIRLLQGDLDSSALRAILIDGGISPEALEQVDDETLVQLYKSTIGVNGSIGSNSSDTVDSQPSENSDSIFSNYENLSIEEIRQLMIDGGVDESTVNQLSNEQLQQVYDDTLKSLLP